MGTDVEENKVMRIWKQQPPVQIMADRQCGIFQPFG